MTETTATTLPLTTIFSAPTSCFSTITYRSDGVMILGDNSDCLPSGAQIYDRTHAFSPALSCPSSYTKALNSFTTAGTATEFRAICCPILDGISPLSGLSFYYNFNTGGKPFYSTLGCIIDFLDSSTFEVLSNGTSSLMHPASWYYGVNAYSVQIAWQASDLPGVSTTPTSASSYSTSAQPASSNLSLASPTSSFSGSSGGDLSTGSKVAIGILVPFAALGIFLAVVLLIQYRRRRGSQNRQAYLNIPGQHIPGDPGVYVERANTENHKATQG